MSLSRKVLSALADIYVFNPAKDSEGFRHMKVVETPRLPRAGFALTPFNPDLPSRFFKIVTENRVVNSTPSVSASVAEATIESRECETPLTELAGRALAEIQGGNAANIDLRVSVALQDVGAGVTLSSFERLVEFDSSRCHLFFSGNAGEKTVLSSPGVETSITGQRIASQIVTKRADSTDGLHDLMQTDHLGALDANLKAAVKGLKGIVLDGPHIESDCRGVFKSYHLSGSYEDGLSSDAIFNRRLKSAPRWLQVGLLNGMGLDTSGLQGGTWATVADDRIALFPSLEAITEMDGRREYHRSFSYDVTTDPSALDDQFRHALSVREQLLSGRRVTAIGSEGLDPNALRMPDSNLSRFWRGLSTLSESYGVVLEKCRGKSVLLLHNLSDSIYPIAYILRHAFEMSVRVADYDEVRDELGRHVEQQTPDLMILGPGPGDPMDDGEAWQINKELFAWAHSGDRRIPVLGICLGHQMLYRMHDGVLGPKVAPDMGVQITVPLHGRERIMGAYNSFSGIIDPLEPGRVAGLEVYADDSGYVSGFKGDGVAGVQQHPESAGTEDPVSLFTDILDGLFPG